MHAQDWMSFDILKPGNVSWVDSSETYRPVSSHLWLHPGMMPAVKEDIDMEYDYAVYTDGSKEGRKWVVHLL